MSPSSADFDLGAFLRSERVRVEEALERALVRLLPGCPERLRPAVRHGVLSSGKRLRPIFCVEAYRSVGGTDEMIYDAAAALEMIHAYSLMHDDLPCMDDADLRRGEPTTHRVEGVQETTVAGAWLIPGAALHLWTAAGNMGLEEPVRRRLVEELARAAGGGGMVGGQILDLLAEGRSLSEIELGELHRRKTGALLTAALKIGGLAGRARESQLSGLVRYGECIGLAFQITDDVLDATATAESLGKNPSDADLRKSTYVSLYGVERAAELAHLEVEKSLRALAEGDIRSRSLEALARYVVERAR